MSHLTSRYLLIVAFVAGAVMTYFVLPPKTKTVVEEKIVLKEVEKKVDVVVTKTIKPDGTIKEKKVVRSVTQTKEKEESEKKLLLKQNERRFFVYGGVNVFEHNRYAMGLSYQLLGPIHVGAQYVTPAQGFITLGVRF